MNGFADVLTKYQCLLHALIAAQRDPGHLGSPVGGLAGLTESERLEFFAHTRTQLEKSTFILLIASIEAELARDMFSRTKGKKRQSKLTDQLRDLEITKVGHVTAVDIVTVWQRHTLTGRGPINRFKAAYKYRNWLAHGQHWSWKDGPEFEIDRVISIQQELRSILRSISPDYPRT
jgi:hypothetical protein